MVSSVEVVVSQMLEIIEDRSKTTILSANEKHFSELNKEELINFIDEKFDSHGFLDLLVGATFQEPINKSIEIVLTLRKGGHFRSTDDVSEALDRSKESYLIDLKRVIKESKNLLFRRLREKQDLERRKREESPF